MRSNSAFENVVILTGFDNSITVFINSDTNNIKSTGIVDKDMSAFSIGLYFYFVAPSKVFNSQAFAGDISEVCVMRCCIVNLLLGVIPYFFLKINMSLRSLPINRNMLPLLIQLPSSRPLPYEPFLEITCHINSLS